MSLILFVWVECLLKTDYTAQMLDFWIFLAILVNLIFLIEFVLHFVAFGAKKVFK